MLGRPPAEQFPPAAPISWAGRLTYATVSLDAIRSNVRAFASLAPSSAVLAVVKADAYGHGAEMVSRAALEAGATWLGVYAVSEGVRLRAARIEAPILVFGPFSAGEARQIVDERLTPSILNLRAGEMLQAASQGRRVPYHLKLDTGLSRSGVAPDDAVSLVAALERFPALERHGLYTHFARADEQDAEPTLRQLQIFNDTARALERHGLRFPVLHVANSAGCIAFPQARLDMVREGISTYGYPPSADIPCDISLTPALSLHSRVTRVHRIPAGTGVGYGHEFRARRDTTIALVPIGYGDGLPRTLGNERGAVLVRGGAAPIAGRVSMDQITVDVTDIPGVTEGDDVTLIGRQGTAVQTAEDLASAAGTISYDILTALLPRVPRLYIDGDRLVAVKEQGMLTMCAPAT